MISPVLLIVLTLGVAGLTRALVIEPPFAWWRDWVKSWSGEDGKCTYLVHCVFCTGFWVGVAGTVLTYYHHDNPLWLYLLLPWAIFAVAPHIADR